MTPVRVLFLSAFVALSAAGVCSASTIDTNLYPAEVSLSLTPDRDIFNGVLLHSQSGTPVGFNGFVTSPFSLTAFETNSVVASLIGPPPFGYYRTFESQQAMFLGTYNNGEESGVVALLPSGVGLEQSFETVFAGFLESDVYDALTDLDIGFLLNFLDVTFNIHPAFLVTEDPNVFELESSQLVAFSNGVNAGSGSGSLNIGPNALPPAVPEPSSLILAALGCLGLVALRRKGR